MESLVEKLYKYEPETKTNEIKYEYKKQIEELMKDGMSDIEADKHLLNKYEMILSSVIDETKNRKTARNYVKTHLDTIKPVFKIDDTTYQVTHAYFRNEYDDEYVDEIISGIYSNTITIGLKKQNKISEMIFDLKIHFYKKTCWFNYKSKDINNIIFQNMMERHTDIDIPSIDTDYILNKNLNDIIITPIQTYEYVYLKIVKDGIKGVHTYLEKYIEPKDLFKSQYNL